MTKPRKPTKISKDDMALVIASHFHGQGKNQGVRNNTTLKNMMLIVEKYDIDVEKEYINVKERKIVYEEESRVREETNKERMRMRDLEQEEQERIMKIEEKKIIDDYEKLPKHVKTLCEKKYKYEKYTNMITHYRKVNVTQMELLEKWENRNGVHKLRSYIDECGELYLNRINISLSSGASYDEFHHCDIIKELIQEMIYIDKNGKTGYYDEDGVKIVVIKRTRKV